MAVLREKIPGRFISHFRDINFPTHSPNLSVPDYFLWGYAKSKIYETHPANIDDLKQQILECIQGIPNEILQHVMAFMPFQLKECDEQQGSHL